MTDHARAIEAGARAFKQRRRDEIEGKVERATFEEMTGIIIEAAIASGELVPASAVAEMRERCAAEVERRNWPCVGDARRIAAMLRALSPAPASGEFVVVPRKLTPDMIVQGYEHVNRDLCEGKGDALDRLWTAMLNAAAKDGSGAK